MHNAQLKIAAPMESNAYPPLPRIAAEKNRRFSCRPSAARFFPPSIGHAASHAAPWSSLHPILCQPENPGVRAEKPVRRKGGIAIAAPINLIPKCRDNFHFGIKFLTVNSTCRQLSQNRLRSNGIKYILCHQPLQRNPRFPARKGSAMIHRLNPEPDAPHLYRVC